VANLISCDANTEKIYKHSGITSTITEDFVSPNTWPSGLTYDGSNLISCDVDNGLIYIHSGITSATTDSFASPYSWYPTGLTYNGSNLISCGQGDVLSICIHSGITSTVTDSFANPDEYPSGLAYDGSNLISIGDFDNTIYIHTGITSTITDSFASPSSYPHGLTCEIFDVIVTTLAPNLVEDGIANLKLNLEDMAGLTIDSVGYYCDENAAPSTEYIETGWGAEIETGIYNIYVKTLPTGETTLYVQAWADDSDSNRYTGSIVSFDIPSEPEYTKLPDIIFPELPEILAIEIDLPDINYNIGLDLYLDRTYTRKDLEELRQKCINYEKNYTDFCLILNHNTLLVKNFLQSAYNNGVLGGENEMFTKIYPSQQLTPLYLEPLEPDDYRVIINRFINNNTSNSMGLNHNFDLFKEWLNDYNYTSDGYKASYITPREEIITNNEPTVKYLTNRINRLQREVSMASREITHNFNLMKEIIQ